MVKLIKEVLELTDNQYNLVVIYLVSFLTSTVCLYIINPKSFNVKWGIITFIFAVMYYVSYYKFFST